MDALIPLLKPASVLLVTILLLFVIPWILKRIKSIPSDGSVVRITLYFLILFAGILAFILTLPIKDELKGQMLGVLGIIMSAGIALSSTTVLGNLIAGVSNNSMNRFRSGDLIKIGDLQGRVTKKSPLYTEIQLEDSNFMTIPNLFIASNPVKLTRKTNTVISTAVSLGYDVSRLKIEEALKEAALATGLTDPYVYITSLGDYSVVYEIHGFLNDSNKFFSTQSRLNEKVIDVLHEKKIEIVSPTFMNQRRVDEVVFIPKKPIVEVLAPEESAPEELIFDEAIKSEKIEKKKDFLKELEKRKEELKEKLKGLKEEEEIQKVRASINRIDEIKVKIEAMIEAHKNPSE